jgi:hypothetical protein
MISKKVASILVYLFLSSGNSQGKMKKMKGGDKVNLIKFTKEKCDSC